MRATGWPSGEWLGRRRGIALMNWLFDRSDFRKCSQHWYVRGQIPRIYSVEIVEHASRKSPGRGEPPGRVIATEPYIDAQPRELTKMGSVNSKRDRGSVPEWRGRVKFFWHSQDASAFCDRSFAKRPAPSSHLLSRGFVLPDEDRLSAHQRCSYLSLSKSALVRSPSGFCLWAATAASRTVMPWSVGSSKRRVINRRIEVVSMGV